MKALLICATISLVSFSNAFADGFIYPICIHLFFKTNTNYTILTNSPRCVTINEGSNQFEFFIERWGNVVLSRNGQPIRIYTIPIDYYRPKVLGFDQLKY